MNSDHVHLLNCQTLLRFKNLLWKVFFVVDHVQTVYSPHDAVITHETSTRNAGRPIWWLFLLWRFWWISPEQLSIIIIFRKWLWRVCGCYYYYYYYYYSTLLSLSILLLHALLTLGFYFSSQSAFSSSSFGGGGGQLFKNLSDFSMF